MLDAFNINGGNLADQETPRHYVGASLKPTGNEKFPYIFENKSAGVRRPLNPQQSKIVAVLLSATRPLSKNDIVETTGRQITALSGVLKILNSIKLPYVLLFKQDEPLAGRYHRQYIYPASLEVPEGFSPVSEFANFRNGLNAARPKTCHSGVVEKNPGSGKHPYIYRDAESGFSLQLTRKQGEIAAQLIRCFRPLSSEECALTATRFTVKTTNLFDVADKLRLPYIRLFRDEDLYVGNEPKTYFFPDHFEIPPGFTSTKQRLTGEHKKPVRNAREIKPISEGSLAFYNAIRGTSPHLEKDYLSPGLQEAARRAPDAFERASIGDAEGTGRRVFTGHLMGERKTAQPPQPGTKTGRGAMIMHIDR